MFGFSKVIAHVSVEKALNAFFEKLATGGTLRQAKDAAQSAILDPWVEIEHNPDLNLDQKLVDYEPPPCTRDFDGRWSGQLHVIRGTALFPGSTDREYRCGDLVLTMTRGRYDECPDCGVSAAIDGRLVVGCAENNRVVLTRDDTDPPLTLSLGIGSDLALAHYEFTDKNAETVEMVGAFTRCR